MHIKQESQTTSNGEKSPTGPPPDGENDQPQLTRPTVIRTTSTLREDRTRDASNESGDHLAFALAQSQQQQLEIKNSQSDLKRLESEDMSLDDLLGKSEEDGRKFDARDFPNFFLSSFLNSEESLMHMDGQTLAWLHGNLKLCIRTHEESLFLMKWMLKTIEDVAAKNSGPEVISEL